MDTVSMLNKMSFYCQPILPLVYDESMSYYETLCKVVGQLNNTGDAVNKLNEGLTGEIADRQAADASLNERLKLIEEADKRTHFLVFVGANPNSAMPTRTELWNWVRNGDIICALYSANDTERGDVYAASCTYNAGNWSTENSSDFHFLIPLETTYDSTGKLAVKQKIVKLTIPSYTKHVLTVPWGEEIIEINTPHTSAEGVVNFTATAVGETVTANITPADFIRLFDAVSATRKLCVGVNARLNYNSLELGSSVATVYDNSTSKREVRITFMPDPHAGRRGYVNSEIFDIVNIVGDKDANTWKIETFGTEFFDFMRYKGFQFTRKLGDVIEADDDCDPSSVAQYYNDLPDKDYQNLPVHFIDEVENSEYWNGTFNSYLDGHITFTFTTANYSTIGDKMVVRVIELSATRTGESWIGNEEWNYDADEFDIPYHPTSFLLDVWKANETPIIDGGLVSYEGGSTLDFDDILPLVQGNQNFVATLHNGTSESGPELSGLIYSKMNVANGIGSITFATTEGVSLNNGIPSMTGIVVFSKDSAGAKKVTITFSSALPVPSADGSDNGKVPTVNGTSWGLKTPEAKSIVDTAMSDTSTNAVQNKVIKKYVDDHSATNAVLYTAQELTYGQKFQARKNIEAAARVVPTITGGVSLCPANVTDSNTAVHTTTTTAGGDDFTLTLDGGPENALVRVKGIRTPTGAENDAAANVEYVKNSIPTALKNPNALTINLGGTTVTYDGSEAKTVYIANGNEVSY